MVDCTTLPTIELAQESKTNMDSINEFIYSNNLTLQDQYGETHKTLYGYSVEAQTRVDNVVYDAEQTVLLSAQAQAAAEAARDTTLTYRDTTQTYMNTTLGYRDETEAFRDTTQTYMNTTLSYRDETEGFKNTTLTYRDTTEVYMNTTLGYRDETEGFKDAAVAATNYAGEWSGLTGNYLKGTTVTHIDVIWLLVSDVSDITTTEPSATNPDWFAVTYPFNYKSITSNENIISAGKYILTGEITVQLLDPATLPDGYALEFVRAQGGAGNPTILSTGNNISTARHGLTNGLLFDTQVIIVLIVKNGFYEV